MLDRLGSFCDGLKFHQHSNGSVNKNWYIYMPEMGSETLSDPCSCSPVIL